MKTRVPIIIFTAILLVVAAVSWVRRGENASPDHQGAPCCPLLFAPNAQPVPANPNPPATQTPTSAAPHTLVACYFHGTLRCETCLLIEALARTVVEQQFAAELAADRLVWQSVNYDLPENSHFLTDFKLPCPSLVLVAQQEGKPLRWKLLGDTWQLVHEPFKLNDYVATEVWNFLSEAEQPTGTATGSASHPNER